MSPSGGNPGPPKIEFLFADKLTPPRPSYNSSPFCPYFRPSLHTETLCDHIEVYDLGDIVDLGRFPISE